MKVEILGTGCKKCSNLYDIVNEIVQEKGLDAQVVKVDDMKVMIGYGVMQTPAMVIDGDVKFYGKSPKKKEVIKYFE